MKSPVKIIGIILVALIVFAIVLPLVVDVNAFRPKIESELSVALGRQVSVGNLHLFIFSSFRAAFPPVTSRLATIRLSGPHRSFAPSR